MGTIAFLLNITADRKLRCSSHTGCHWQPSFASGLRSEYSSPPRSILAGSCTILYEELDQTRSHLLFLMLEDLPDRRESFIRWLWEVTRGLSGVFLVTPSVLVSIAVSGISEWDLKCRGSHYHDDMGPRNPTSRVFGFSFTGCNKVVCTMEEGGGRPRPAIEWMCHNPPPHRFPWWAFIPLYPNLWGWCCPSLGVDGTRKNTVDAEFASRRTALQCTSQLAHFMMLWNSIQTTLGLLCPIFGTHPSHSLRLCISWDLLKRLRGATSSLFKHAEIVSFVQDVICRTPLKELHYYNKLINI